MPTKLTFKTHWLARHVAAVAAVGAGLLVRLGLTALVGEGLPTYITFYPVIMSVALFGGIGPGLVATLTTALAVDYWLLPPTHEFGVAHLVDAVGLAFFAGMGVFMSVVAELYRRGRQRAVGHETDLLRREGQETPRQPLGETALLVGGLVLALAILGAVGWQSYRNLAATVQAENWVSHSYIVDEGLEHLFATLQDMEASERGYLIMGEEDYLRPYNTAKLSVAGQLASLERLTADNPGQAQRLKDIEALVDAKLAELKEVIEVRRSQGLEAAHTLMAKSKGEILTEQIRQRLTEAEEEELRLLHLRTADRDADLRKTLQALLAGGVISLLLLTTVFVFLTQENGRRRRAEAELRRHQADLQKTIAIRTADLSQANESLGQQVAEERRAQAALRESQRQNETLASVIEHSSQPFGMGYPDGRLGLINRAFEQLTGYSAEELRSMDWVRTLTPPEWREIERQKLEKLHATGQPVCYEKEYLRKDGSRVPIELLVHLARDGEGNPEYYYSFLTDITERKLAEAAVHQLNAELRQRLADLQAANQEVQSSRRAALSLAEDAQEARKQAERANADLQKANESLGASRHAALNMMDDAVRARHSAEQASADLRRASEQRRLALEAADLGAWDYRFQTGEVSWDERSRAMWGLPLCAQVDYSAAINQIHPEDRAEVDEAVKQALAGKDAGAYHTEFRVGWPDGSVHWIASHGRVYFEGEGAQRSAVRFIGVNREITREKLAEQALRQSEERYRGLVELSPEAVLVNRNDRIVLVNPAGLRLFGASSAEQLLGKSLFELFHADYRALKRERIGKMLAGERTPVLEEKIVRLDGVAVDVEVAGAPVTDRGERAILVLVRDITERKRAQAALQQTAAELERSNRDLEQFAYVASHDLQEPLRAVGGYVKLLQHRFPDKLNAKARGYIAGAFEGATRMERLITDLLAFSRIGTRGGNFAPTDLDAVLNHALSNLQAGIDSAQATITHDPLPTLSVDPTQMMQLFQNLIGNALKFQSQSPPVIHVGAQRQEGRWLFCVRDNGIGIEPQYFEKIFHVFQRLHTRTDYPGTGIGLAICKKIVERHGGTIWVESQPGQGSTFNFTISEAAAR